MSDNIPKNTDLPDEQELKEIEHHLRSVNPDIFAGLNKKKKEELLKSITVTFSKSHSGPLPTPETLEHYNVIIPNGAERIMRMAEKQQEHRQSLERKVIPSQLNQSRTGQIFGFYFRFDRSWVRNIFGLLRPKLCWGNNCRNYRN